MKRALSVVAILAGVQMALAGFYLLARDGDRGEGAGAEQLSGPAPSLSYEHPDGREGALEDHLGRPVVVHFWATWCGPCREELPALLAFAEDTNADVLALSLDSDWADIRRFLGGKQSAPVVRTTPEAARESFGVRSLPETFVVDSDGRMRLVFDGARDWSDGAVRRAVRAVE